MASANGYYLFELAAGYINEYMQQNQGAVPFVTVVASYVKQNNTRTITDDDIKEASAVLGQAWSNVAIESEWYSALKAEFNISPGDGNGVSGSTVLIVGVLLSALLFLSSEQN